MPSFSHLFRRSNTLVLLRCTYCEKVKRWSFYALGADKAHCTLFNLPFQKKSGAIEKTRRNNNIIYRELLCFLKENLCSHILFTRREKISYSNTRKHVIFCYVFNINLMTVFTWLIPCGTCLQTKAMAFLKVNLICYRLDNEDVSSHLIRATASLTLPFFTQRNWLKVIQA